MIKIPKNNFMDIYNERTSHLLIDSSNKVASMIKRNREAKSSQTTKNSKRRNVKAHNGSLFSNNLALNEDSNIFIPE